MIAFCKLLDTQTGKVDHDLDPTQIDESCAVPGKLVWLDIHDPNEDDLKLLKQEFPFHPLSLEDCSKAHSRPKLERYRDYVFIVVYEVRPEAVGHGLRMVELNIFLGRNYVVTVHRAKSEVITGVIPRWEKHEGEGLQEGASFLAYMLIDAAVDTYFPILDSFSDQLENLEEQIFDDFQESVVQDIFRLKKQTLAMRRLVTPLRDVFLILLRRDESNLGPHSYDYFQDVLDHLLRVSDAIDNYRDLVGSAVDAYMTTVSNRTNETMKKLTVLSTTLMLVSLVSGLYGMNFKYMPELEWRYGYYYALGLMVVLVGSALGLFRWKKYI